MDASGATRNCSKEQEGGTYTLNIDDSTEVKKSGTHVLYINYYI